MNQRGYFWDIFLPGVRWRVWSTITIVPRHRIFLSRVQIIYSCIRFIDLIWSTRWMCKKCDFKFQCWNQKMSEKKKLKQEWLAIYFRCVVPILQSNFTTPDWFHTTYDLHCSAFVCLISGSSLLLPVYCCFQLKLWFRVIYCHLLWTQ